MGQYFKIINLDKRQYFSPSIFDEGIKKTSILQGMHAYALGKLITYGGELSEENKKWRKGNEQGIWFGAWAGDKIAIVGDYAKSNLLGIEPTNPENKAINLYELAELEFENIGGKLILWLINDEKFADWLSDRLKTNEQYIGKIGYIAYKFPDINEELKIFLENNYGKAWEKKSKEVWEDRGNTFVEPDI